MSGFRLALHDGNEVEFSRADDGAVYIYPDSPGAMRLGPDEWVSVLTHVSPHPDAYGHERARELHMPSTAAETSDGIMRGALWRIAQGVEDPARAAFDTLSRLGVPVPEIEPEDQ